MIGNVFQKRESIRGETNVKSGEGQSRAGRWRSIAAALILALGIGTAAEAAPRVQVGQAYEGEYYLGSKVTFYVTHKDPNFEVYYGTMRVHFNNDNPDIRIAFLSDGRIEVMRYLLNGNVQFFAGDARRTRTADGRIVWEVRNLLRGEGVSGADNEVGILLLPE